jgi:alanyl-tRNA synthetase
MFELVAILAEQFNDVFPELNEQLDFVSKVIREEEVSFLRTLENGLKIFNEALASAQKSAEENLLFQEILLSDYTIPMAFR